MIQPVVLYQCVCDNCKEVIEFGKGWKAFAREDLEAWIDNEEYCMQVIDGQHICDNCISHDEEGVKFVNPKRTIL